MTALTQHYRIKTLGNLELLHTQNVADGYAQHLHEEYALCYLQTGHVKTYYRGSTVISPAKSFTLMNPTEPHRGEVLGEERASYYSLYFSAQSLQDFCTELFNHATLPYFKQPVIIDKTLGHKLHCFLGSLGGSKLETQTHYLSFLSCLVERYADTPFTLPSIQQDSKIECAKDYLHAHYHHDVTLDELAGVVELNRAYLIRAFKKRVGLPPHAYLTQVRLNEAKKQLAQGLPIAEVAISTGFADQSHFSRTFKHTFGLTPGAYSSYRSVSEF
jgi:AraC-like DNA-binding protein